MLTKFQHRAILRPVKAPTAIDNSELQAVWNSPYRMKINAKKNWCIVIAVIQAPDGTYGWMASVRIEKRSQQHFKPRDQWTLEERVNGHKILTDFLLGVGDESTIKEDTFELGSILTKTLNSKELSIVLRPQLLGTMGVNTNGNANRPGHEGGPAADEATEDRTPGEDQEEQIREPEDDDRRY